MWYVIVLFIATNVVVGQIVYNGACNVTVEQADHDVDILSMLGTWYQQGRIPNEEETGDCSSIFYYLVNPTTGGVISKEVVDGNVRKTYGIVTRKRWKPVTFHVTFASGSFDYYVLSTNYNEYALIYSCQNITNNTRNVRAWLLSRTRYYAPSVAVVQELAAVVARNPDINVLSWSPVNQNGCDHYKH